MNRRGLSCVALSAAVFTLNCDLAAIAEPALSIPDPVSQTHREDQQTQPQVLSINEFLANEIPHAVSTPRERLSQQTSQPETPNPPSTDSEEIDIQVTGKPDPFAPTSSPVYTLPRQEIDRKKPNSLSDILRNLPGFAINDVGFGADIHTGTFYRGQSINQSVFLLNGRPIGSNINTYHGATDLNSIPIDAIEQVELSSGTSTTLYGSEAFGGVVNITTRQGKTTPEANAQVQFGSYGLSNYRLSYGGTSGILSYLIGFERFSTNNNYPVPVGAANRGSDGRLFNGDTAKDNFYGNFVFNLDARNTLNLDAYKVASRRGLLYFGFPLQRDRLDHDFSSIGLSWKTLLGNGNDSILTTSLAYTQDYFNTYGPTQNVFYRTGTLDSQAITGRIEHQWQTSPNNKLTWGVDIQNNSLNGNVFSTNPSVSDQNEVENRNRFRAALFALNTWQLTDTFQMDFGLRQNFTNDFGSYLNPSVGARWAVAANVAVRGSLAAVQRNPGLDQLYVFDTVHNWLSNPNLQPEKGSSWTAGVDVAFAENLTGQFTYFASSLDNRLGIINGRWENVGLVNTRGLEVALRWKITPEFSTFANYTYTNARIESGVEKGLQLSTVPYSVGQIGFGYESQGWQVNLFVSYFSGARRALFVNTGLSNLEFSPAYLNLDLSARIPLSKNFALTLYLENLADVTYEKVNRIYQPGLTYRVGLQSTF